MDIWLVYRVYLLKGTSKNYLIMHLQAQYERTSF